MTRVEIPGNPFICNKFKIDINKDWDSTHELPRYAAGFKCTRPPRRCPSPDRTASHFDSRPFLRGVCQVTFQVIPKGHSHPQHFLHGARQINSHDSMTKPLNPEGSQTSSKKARK